MMLKKHKIIITIIIIIIIIIYRTFQHLHAGKPSPIPDCRWHQAQSGEGNLPYPHVIIIIIIITYLLTPWSRVLLEKLTGSATSQEIPRIFGTRRFLTVPTSARHLSLS